MQIYSTAVQIYLILFFRFSSVMDYYRILSIFPCAVEQVLVGYLVYT